MGGSDDGDGNALQLGNRLKDRTTEYGDDIDVVAQCLLLVEAEVRTLIVKYATSQSPVAAEGITGEEDFFLLQVGHHRLRPMDEGSVDKSKRTIPQRQRVPIVYDLNVLGDAVESLEHILGLLRAQDRHIGYNSPERTQDAGVVRLHVVDDHVVEFGKVDDLMNLIQELVGLQRPAEVDHRVLLIVDQVRIV